MSLDDVPKPPIPTRKQALARGAAYCERELHGLRGEAMRADGYLPGAQYKTEPSGEAERIYLSTLELATAAAILREMAKQEDDK